MDIKLHVLVRKQQTLAWSMCYNTAGRSSLHMELARITTCSLDGPLLRHLYLKFVSGTCGKELLS